MASDNDPLALRSANRPKLSIITVSFNCRDELERTIKSVLAQSIKSIEYIVIDGGSQDGTYDLLKSYSDQIDYWVSERDSGIYDAMNKGCAVAQGEGVLFLNAGDYIVGDLLDDDIMVPAFIPVKIRYRNGFERLQKIRSVKSGMPCSHQGIIFKNKGVLYDRRFEICSDYDYFLRHGDFCLYNRLNYQGSYVLYDNSGLSNSQYKKRDVENFKIIKKRFGIGRASLFLIKAIGKGVLKEVFFR
ncbi:glycosyltransferase [uncultured Marinobacter sp.]|uniref:glycosyltransferase n=1 Tax=uncultured Marinobacter sp. TaxID=187379 RepID=UPI0030C83F83